MSIRPTSIYMFSNDVNSKPDFYCNYVKIGNEIFTKADETSNFQVSMRYPIVQKYRRKILGVQVLIDPNRGVIVSDNSSYFVKDDGIYMKCEDYEWFIKPNKSIEEDFLFKNGKWTKIRAYKNKLAKYFDKFKANKTPENLMGVFWRIMYGKELSLEDLVNSAKKAATKNTKWEKFKPILRFMSN